LICHEHSFGVEIARGLGDTLTFVYISIHTHTIYLFVCKSYNALECGLNMQ